jgi:hypothetical protein
MMIIEIIYEVKILLKHHNNRNQKLLKKYQIKNLVKNNQLEVELFIEESYEQIQMDLILLLENKL